MQTLARVLVCINTPALILVPGCFQTVNLLILLKGIGLCCCKCKRSGLYVDCYWSRLANLYIDMFKRCNHYPCILLRFVAGSAEHIAVLGSVLAVKLFSCHFHDPLRSICLPQLISCCVLPSSCPLQCLSRSAGIYWPSNICLWHCAFVLCLRFSFTSCKMNETNNKNINNYYVCTCRYQTEIYSMCCLTGPLFVGIDIYIYIFVKRQKTTYCQQFLLLVSSEIANSCWKRKMSGHFVTTKSAL